MKINLENFVLPDNKRLIEIKDATFSYTGSLILWQELPLNLVVYSGERIWIQGDNGSGKSALLKMITGKLEPASGEIFRSSPLTTLYIDQEYSCIDDDLTVYGIRESCNSRKCHYPLLVS